MLFEDTLVEVVAGTFVKAPGYVLATILRRLTGATGEPSSGACWTAGLALWGLAVLTLVLVF